MTPPTSPPEHYSGPQTQHQPQQQVPSQVAATKPKKGKGRAAVEDSSEGNEQKRRRVQRACDSCRKRKIKCDSEGASVACMSCTKHGLPCTFAERARKPPLRNYIEAMESRMEKMEKILKELAPGRDFTPLIGELPTLGSGVTSRNGFLDAEEDIKPRTTTNTAPPAPTINGLKREEEEAEDRESSEDEKDQLELESIRHPSHSNGTLHHSNLPLQPPPPPPQHYEYQRFDSRDGLQHQSHQSYPQYHSHSQPRLPPQQPGLQISSLLNSQPSNPGGGRFRPQSSYSSSNLRATT